MMPDFDANLRTLALGYTWPYHGERPKDRAEQIACAVLVDLCDRRGIKSELDAVDDEVKKDIVTELAGIIRKGLEVERPPQFEDYDELMKHLRKLEAEA